MRSKSEYLPNWIGSESWFAKVGGGSPSDAAGGVGPSARLYDTDPVRAPQTNPSVADAPVDVVVVGGVDPSGGAGLLRDVVTARARGARAVAVGTAWTEQGPGVHQVEARAPEAVRDALGRALGAGPGAVKVGMAVGPATAAAILEALGDFRGPVVLDPVLSSTRGGPLWAGAPAEILPLARRATLITPNAAEAAALTGGLVSTSVEAEAAGRRLVEDEGVNAVLVKGGHLPEIGDELDDLLVTRGATRRLRHRRVPGAGPRGTGCALATAIAIELGRGRELGSAVQVAVAWLVDAIASARDAGGERHL
jgi:hydroxymethylpyrimidine/phosphomethylpyrimidine kinase